MSLQKLIATSGSISVGLSVWAQTALAASTLGTGLSGADTNLDAIGSAATLTNPAQTDLPTLIGRIINVILGLLGIVFVAFVVYAGVLWMTAQGEQDKTKKAMSIIRNGIIGMVITVAAYAISNFVISALVTATA